LSPHTAPSAPPPIPDVDDVVRRIAPTVIPAVATAIAAPPATITADPPATIAADLVNAVVVAFVSPSPSRAMFMAKDVVVAVLLSPLIKLSSSSVYPSINFSISSTTAPPPTTSGCNGYASGGTDPGSVVMAR
jgi:hypothetical protein